MSNLASYNKFSVLGDDSDDDKQTESLQEGENSNKTTAAKTDIIMTIVDPENEHTVIVTPTNNKPPPKSSLQKAVPTCTTVTTSIPRSIPPPLPSVNQNNNLASNNAPVPPRLVWTQVGANQLIKEEKAIQEDYSSRYAPMYLPPEPVHDFDWTIPINTNKVLPVTVRVTAPSKYKVKNGRVLVALLRGLQKVDPVTYIAPTCDGFENEKILHPSQVPPDDDSVS
jgi:hypothetical protein